MRRIRRSPIPIFLFYKTIVCFGLCPFAPGSLRVPILLHRLKNAEFFISVAARLDAQQVSISEAEGQPYILWSSCRLREAAPTEYSTVLPTLHSRCTKLNIYPALGLSYGSAIDGTMGTRRLWGPSQLRSTLTSA